jgi:hypothetical protein
MNWLLAALILQYMVSATAGLVGQVRGQVNAKTGQIVAAGTSVETGGNGLVDLQLNPGAYLRLRADSAAVFKSTSLDAIEFDITKGHAIVDFDTDSPFPVKVTAGSLSFEIRKSGVYGISPDAVSVFDGQLEPRRGTILRKGDSAIIQSDGLHLKKLSKEDVKLPYAADRLKLFVQPKLDKDNNVPNTNSMFISYLQQNFKDIHDVEIVTKADGADYVLTVDATQKSGFRRINGSAGILVTTELKDADGTVVFSNQRDDDLDDEVDNRVTSIDLFMVGDTLAKQIVQYVTNRTHWR